MEFLPIKYQNFQLLMLWCIIIKVILGSDVPKLIMFNQQCDGENYRAALVFTLKEKLLPGSVAEIITVDDEMMCARQCLRETWCVSINYKTTILEKNCELNTKGLTAKQLNKFESEQFLVSRSSYLFSQIRPLEVRLKNLFTCTVKGQN